MKGPSFPVAGVGSIILGIILAVMPNTFITWVVYILAALLILGAINQFMGLASSRQYSQVPIFYWFFPTAILVVAILVISKPIEAAALPLQIIGWSLMCYGLIELVLLIILYNIKNNFKKTEHANIVTGDKLIADNIQDTEVKEK